MSHRQSQRACESGAQFVEKLLHVSEKLGEARMANTNVSFGLKTIAITMALACIACGGDEAEALSCVEVDPACAPGFPPTWDNVYKFVITQSCAVGAGVACHGADGRKGMLEMSTPAIAYEGLVRGTGSHPRVTANDPACSILMERLNATDPSVRMPYGAAELPAATRCAVQQWIAQGAAE